MKISTLLQSGKPMLSFEVFPPKTSDTFDSIRSATEEIAALHPHFMSVTCGAGGNSPQNSGYTVDIANNKFGVDYGSFDFMANTVRASEVTKV